MSSDNDTDLLLNKILEKIDEGRNILLHGPGGTGKTYILKKIYHSLKKIYNIKGTATTGIAAVNMSDEYFRATTIHSWAGVKLAREKKEKLLSKVQCDSRAVKRWKSIDILMIDEVSMLGQNFFEKLDYIAKRLRRSLKNKADLPFGGIQLIMCGDFLQLPPVKDNFVFEGQEWKDLNLYPIIFSKPKRFDDLKYFNFLSRLRIGTLSEEDLKLIKIRYRSYKKLMAYIENAKNTKKVIKPTILYSKRADVNDYNNGELNKLDGDPHYFEAKDSFKLKKKYKNEKVNPKEYESFLNKSIPQTIILKEGAQVMLKFNIDVKAGLVNGCRGVVTKIQDNILSVKFVGLPTKTIEPILWKVKTKKGTASRMQVPLILCWSSTIHKIQGCTINYAILDMGHSIFSEGQAYVGLSRVRNKKSLFISDYYENSIKANSKALNYVRQIENKN
jgi:ATP-dependent DNA helicase PIF1